MKTREYHYRGQIETGRHFRWSDGFSAYADEEARRGILFGWMTRRQCQADAKRDGRAAVFYRDGVRL